MSVVCVAVCRKLTDQVGVQWVADVHDVEPSFKGVGSHPICPGCAFIDDNVVSVAPTGIQGVGFDGLWRIGDGPELGQVHHLHAVASRFCDDEGMVAVDLDVPPE